MAKSGHQRVDRVQESGRAGHEGRGGRSAPEVDLDGVPASRPVADWLDFDESGGDLDFDSRWLQAVLRFSRPDGSPVFGPIGRAAGRLKALETWAARLGDPGLSGVVARWGPARPIAPSPPSPPPLPSDSRPDRPLAILRGDWAPQGDLVAIDHRTPGDATLLEVGSRGKTWLGPTWTSGSNETKFAKGRPNHWSSETFAHCVEWSYRSGSDRVTRIATLLRGRSMALLGQQVDGLGSSNEVRLALPDGVEASLGSGSRMVRLSTGRGKPTAHLIPLGLPAHDRPTDRGSIAIEGREVVIRQTGEGRRRWLPALICWGKAPTTWRTVTVAYRSKATRDDQAAAARVAWGRNDEGLVVYRSLAPPSLRCFLGHQTGSRFLVGAFTRSGDVRPILKVDA